MSNLFRISVYQSSNTFIRFVQFLILLLSVVMLGVVFYPVVQIHSLGTQRTRMLSNGRAIHQAILSYNLTPVAYPSSLDPWPLKESEYYEANSTAYFQWLMSSEVEWLPEDFGLFSGADVPQANSLENFQSENNAWSVVSDVSIDSASQTPFLVTRNLNESRLVDWQDSGQNRFENLGSGKPGGYVTPYDREYVIVINIGGGGHVLSKRNLNWENLNPASIDNVIMEP